MKTDSARNVRNFIQNVVGDIVAKNISLDYLAVYRVMVMISIEPFVV